MIAQFEKSLSFEETGGASPGFKWARSGQTPTNTWLESDSIPSNTTGDLCTVNGQLVEATISCQNDTTCDVQIYKRTDPGPVYTSIATISLTAQRKNTQSFVGVNVAKGDELCAQLTSGSALNVKVTAIITGIV